MRTAVEMIEIVCPDWCATTSARHAAELWRTGGECHHMPDEVAVADRAGIVVDSLTERNFCAPFLLSMATRTQPNGRECGSTVFYLNDHELSLQQALDVSAAIVRLVDRYQAEFPDQEVAR